MPEPDFNDLIHGSSVETTSEESVFLICKVDAARVAAAYWQGRCEGHEREIAQIKEAHELTIGYLKDRLNRLEKPPQA